MTSKPPVPETDAEQRDPPYEVEFFEDDDGTEPALTFMKSLAPFKRRAIGVAINELLAYEGPNVADGNMGKNLGKGLYEFRLDQTAEQVLRRKGRPRSQSRRRGRSCSESSSIRMATS